MRPRGVGLSNRMELKRGAFGPYPLALVLQELGCGETAALVTGRVDCYPDAPEQKAVRRALRSLTQTHLNETS